MITRGADVVVKLVDAKESGKLTGRTTLTIDMTSLKVNGRMVDVNTETVTEESSSRGAEILTKGQRVRIPSETRLTFVLENAVRL